MFFDPGFLGSKKHYGVTMYEVRFHGRGGQGAVLAAKILAKALVEEGKHVKAIPSFGFERRGAPVEAFLRFDEKIIRQTTNIYQPDCIICLDPTLSRAVNIFAGMRVPGVWVQATKKKIEAVVIPPGVVKVGLCDAFGIALELFGRVITNSIMLGAFSRTTGLVSLDALEKAMQSVDFRDAALEKNIQALQRGYDETRVHETK
jgi:pyruvate ferredoxin oxidoreductase gamma subunit/phenylglyoxylate dehydrogenase gamma subunit